MRAIVFGIAFLLGILLVSGCLQFPEKTTPPDKKIVDKETYELPGKLRVTVSVSNTAPKVGELVSFSYSVIYEGKQVKVVFVQKRSWEDTSSNNFERRVTELENGSNSVGLTTKIFNEEGEYTYELGIFNCKEVEVKLKTTCENAQSEDIFNSVKPVKLAHRTVNVEGETETFEDCGDSQICFFERMENCLPTTTTVQVFEETKVTIQGIENEKCKVHYLTIKSPNPDLEGLDYTCLVPLDRLSDYEQFLAESVTTACTGPYWDYLLNPPGVEEEPDENPEDFLSEQSCEKNSDCLYTEHPACFLKQQCVKPNQFLSDYIHQNYETGNCSEIFCENCQTGTLVVNYMGYQVDEFDFDETFCIECTSDNFFKCNEGYECNLGKCVEA